MCVLYFLAQKDLATIAEFASEIESESPLEVTRYQKLAAVGMTYGPLIYLLKDGVNFDKLVEIMKTVKVNLDKNPQMAARLVS